MAHADHVHPKPKVLKIEPHAKMVTKQYLAACHEPFYSTKTNQRGLKSTKSPSRQNKLQGINKRYPHKVCKQRNYPIRPKQGPGHAPA